MGDVQRMSRGRKLAFSMGDIYAGGFFNIINFYYAIFLTDVVGINATWAGLIFTLSKIWDAITDPLMGQITDHTKSRMGRRRPYFIYGIPLIILSFAMMWFPVDISTETYKVLYYAFAYMFANTIATMVQVPYLAMAAEVSLDYNERNSITGIRMVISLLSSIVCASAPYMIVARFQQPQKGYMVMGIVFGIFFALPWIFTFFSTKEVVHMPLENKKKKTSVLKLFKIKVFRKYNYMYLSIFVLMDLISMMYAYYLTYVLQRESITSQVLATLLICEVLNVPFATALANKIGKTKLISIGALLWMIGCFGVLCIHKNSSVIWIYVLSGVMGAIISFSLIGIISLFGEITDVGELFMGERLEGSFSGLQQFSRKCASGVANGAALMILGKVGFMEPIKQGELIVKQVQSQSVLDAIQEIIVVPAVVLLLPTIVIAWKWKLNATKHRTMMEYLEKKEQKETITNELEEEITALKRELF